MGFLRAGSPLLSEAQGIRVQIVNRSLHMRQRLPCPHGLGQVGLSTCLVTTYSCSHKRITRLASSNTMSATWRSLHAVTWCLPSLVNPRRPYWLPCRSFITRASGLDDDAIAPVADELATEGQGTAVPLKKPRKKRAPGVTSVRKKKAPLVVKALEAPGRPEKANQSLPTDLPEMIYGTPPEGPHWGAVNRWVVFSDLHLSRRTCDICVQVLQRVHLEASARNAGILFLGDFWHARGALPVEPLNAVLRQLATWTQPALFIPGNHDQVTLGGLVHGLTALESANEKLAVLSAPTPFLGALWLPYRWNHAEIGRAIANHPDALAIFCHVDIVGAFMNEAFQAKQGLPPAQFPAGIPVYTGHYHKPHVVEGTSIRYVGSPYQVSLSEAGQAKHLLVLDNSWQVVEEVEIDIGPRHHILPAGTLPEPAALDGVRSGDRVRWQIPPGMSQLDAKTQTEWLRQLGAEVDLLQPLPEAKLRIAEAEHLDAFSLFGEFARSTKLRQVAIDEALRILRSLDLPARLLHRPHATLVLDSVELEGYGPFLGAVKYPLGGRGVRVISGHNMDSPGADSNGAGKTALVMAPLWALSGSTDPRPDSLRGLTASEVIHQSATSARVRVEGTIGGRPFCVERTAGRRPGLTLELGGEVLTCQEMRLTQLRIEDLVDTAVLQRAAFHGQHAAGTLLEATDKEFKEELSRVVVMDVWAAAKEQSRLALREAQPAADRVQGRLDELARQAALLERQVDEFRRKEADWELAKQARVERCQVELRTLSEEFAAAVGQCQASWQRLSGLVQGWAAAEARLTQMALPQNETPGEAGTAELADELAREEAAAAARRERAWREAARLDLEVHAAQKNVESLRKQQLAYASDIEGLQICEKCRQPVDKGHMARNKQLLEEGLSLADAMHSQRLQEKKEADEALRMGEVALAAAAQRRRDEKGRRAAVAQEQHANQLARQKEVIATQQQLAASQQVLDECQSFLACEATQGTVFGQAVPASQQENARRKQNVPIEHMSMQESATSTGGNASAAAVPSQYSSSVVTGLVAGKQESWSSGKTGGMAVPCDEAILGSSCAGIVALACSMDMEILKEATLETGVALRLACHRWRQVGDARLELQVTEEETNPYAGERALLEKLQQESAEAKQSQEDEVKAIQERVDVLKEVDAAFSLSGVQSHVLEGVLGEIQQRSAHYLQALSGGSLALQLCPTKQGKGGRAASERIDKLVFVRSADGSMAARSLRQLSGGERRRIALALQLAYADVTARRSGLACDLLVLDEVLQHLDREGKARMVSILRDLPQQTVLLVSQAHSDVAEGFDLVDWVIKQGDASLVVTAEEGPLPFIS